MTSIKKHHKHPPLAKPALGNWGRNEIALIGAPCGVIRSWADARMQCLAEQWNVCFVDEDHSDTEAHAAAPFQGAALLTNKLHSWRLDQRDEPTKFERRALLSAYDVILVNGNHFTAEQQIVFLHSKKRESLQRKLDRLTQVVGIVECDITINDCDFLLPYVSEETPVFSLDEHTGVDAWIRERVTMPQVRGLVLTGGKSQRMGSDKSRMAYHGKAQRDVILELLTTAEIPVALSCRADQLDEQPEGVDVIPDRFMDLGPFGAILTAMLSDPDSAWLVVATDLPLMDEETIRQLLSERNPAKVATAFHNPETNFPEPLITLWEPKAYPVLLSYLAQGIACPRKALINSDVHVIPPQQVEWLTNVNTPEEAEAVRRKLA